MLKFFTSWNNNGNFLVPNGGKMIIFFSSLMTLVLASIFTFQTKKISLVNQFNLFFLSSMLLINSMTILSLNKHFIEYTHQKEGFFAFILYRDGVFPLLFLIFLNAYKQIKKNKVKTLLVLGMLVSFFVIEFTAVWAKLLVYIHWHWILSVLLYLSFFVILVYVLKFLEHKESEEEI
jgi:hypothetical protein